MTALRADETRAVTAIPTAIMTDMKIDTTTGVMLTATAAIAIPTAIAMTDATTATALAVTEVETIVAKSNRTTDLAIVIATVIAASETTRTSESRSRRSTKFDNHFTSSSSPGRPFQPPASS